MATLRLIANLWTVLGHPAAAAEWGLDRKLEAIGGRDLRAFAGREAMSCGTFCGVRG